MASFLFNAHQFFISLLSKSALSLFCRASCLSRVARTRRRTVALSSPPPPCWLSTPGGGSGISKEIEAIKEGAGQPPQIAQRLLGRSAIVMTLIMSGWAGIHGRNQLEMRRIVNFRPSARNMYFPDSIGSRRASNTLRSNSGSSSRNSTPLWASEISPGAGMAPPPTMAATEAL